MRSTVPDPKSVPDPRGQVPGVPDPKSDIELHVERVAVDLRASIGAVVTHAIGGSPRPATLSRKTGLSPSLAARVLRSLKADQALGVLKDMPSPQGLNMLVDAARALAVPEEILVPATESIDRYEELINGFPTGRTGLHAAMAGKDDSTRDRAARDAIQSVFRSMTTLLGFHAERMVHTLFLVPAIDDPDRCDVAVLMYKVGISRYRLGSPMTIFGRRLSDESDPSQYVEPLAGLGQTNKRLEYLLDAQFAEGSEYIEVFKGPRLYLYTIPGDKPALGESVDFSGACVSRNAYQRYASKDHRWEWESIVPRIPAKALTVQMFVHDSIKWDREPVLTASLHGLNNSSERPGDPSFELDQVENTSDLKRLENNAQSLAIPGIPGYSDTLSRIADALGSEMKSFRCYGTTVAYPVPLIAQTIWFPLTEV